MKKNNALSLFDDMFETFFPSVREDMKSDVKENENEYEIDIELPGFKKEEVNVSIDDGYLTVKAEHKAEDKNEGNHKYIRQERSYRALERSYYVGDVNEDAIKAKLESGVLTLSIPKKEIVKPQETHIAIE